MTKIRFPRIPLALLLGLLPLAASAADLTLGIGGSAQYDSNVFRRTTDVEDDVLFRIIPSVKLHEDRGQDVNYALKWQMPIVLSVENGNQLNAIDQLVDADGLYHASDRLDIFAGDNFRYLRSTAGSVSFSTDSVVAGTDIPILNTERDRVTLNTAELGASYRFAPRLTGTLRAEHDFFDSTRPDRQENWALTGVGDLSYAVNAKHQVGIGVRFIHQQFDDSINVVGSQSYTANGFLEWRYQFDETTLLTVNAGPSWIRTEQDDAQAFTPGANQIPFVAVSGDLSGLNLIRTNGAPATGSAPAGSIAVNSFGCTIGASQVTVTPCGPGVLLVSGADQAAINQVLAAPIITLVNPSPQGASSNDITVFGGVSLTKRWSPTISTALRYDRSQGGASGLGGTVIRDAVSFSGNWDFLERWRFSLRGDWVLRNSVTEATTLQNLAAPVPLAGVPLITCCSALQGTQLSLQTSANSIETERWGVAGRFTHNFTRNTDIFLQLSYSDQSSQSGSLGQRSDFQDFLASLEVQHRFDPIKLW